MGDWLSRVDKDAKEARNKRIFELWLACWTQQEIADAVGVPRKTIDDTFGEFGDLAKLAKTEQAAAEHAIDFDVPIYNIWKQQTKWTIEASVDGSLSLAGDSVQGGRAQWTIEASVAGSKMHRNQHDRQQRYRTRIRLRLRYRSNYAQSRL